MTYNYQYMELNEIKEKLKDKGDVMVMGERRWSASQVNVVRNNLTTTQKAPENNGFFRTKYDAALDLTDACRLIFFTATWQLTCIFNDEQMKYLVHENTSDGDSKECKTIKNEKDRFTYAVELGVLETLPETETLVVNNDDATWRIKPL